MEVSSQCTGNGGEPNALWSVLFTSSQEHHAPPFESEPQLQAQLPQQQDTQLLQHQSEDCGTGALVADGPSLPSPGPTQTVPSLDRGTRAASAPNSKDDHIRHPTVMEPHDMVLPPALATESQPQLLLPQSVPSDAAAFAAAASKETRAANLTAPDSSAREDNDMLGTRNPEARIEAVMLAPPSATSAPESLPPPSLALDLNLSSSSAPPEQSNPEATARNSPTDRDQPTGSEAAHLCTGTAAAEPADSGKTTTATANEPTAAAALSTDMEVGGSSGDGSGGSPGVEGTAAARTAIVTPAPPPEVLLEDDLEDPDADPVPAAGGEHADGDDSDGGGAGRRLKRLRRAQSPTPAAAPEPSSAQKRKADDSGNQDRADGTAGGGEGRPAKALRKRVVVRSAVGDDFEDLQPPPVEGGADMGAGGSGTGRETEAAGASGAEPGAAGPEGEGREADAEEEDGGDEGAGAGPAEDPEVAKQRLLREAALRDRIGGRAVAEAPVRPLSDVLSRIMARQRSLVERTRANAPVSDEPPPAAAAAAPPPHPAAPPTFNVRALMQSLAQNKQQQQQQQPTLPTQQQPTEPASVATQAPASQLDLDLRLHGSEVAVPALDLQMSQVATGTVAQSQQHGADSGGAAAAADVEMAEAAKAGTAAGCEDGGEDDDLVVEGEAPPPSTCGTPFNIRGLRPLEASAAAAAVGTPRGQTVLVYDEGSQPTQQEQAPQQQERQDAAAGGSEGASRPASGDGHHSRGGVSTATLVPLIDLAHRAPSLPIPSSAAAGGGGAGLDQVDVDLDLGEEDDLIVEPDPDPAPVGTPKEPKQQQAGTSTAGKQQEGDGKRGPAEAAVATEGEGAEAGEAEEDEEAEAEEDEEAEEAEGEEEEGAAGEAAEGEEEGQEEEEEEADEEAGEEGLVYDVDEEYDSTDEEDAVEPEALHFEEEEAATAAGAGLGDGAEAAAGGGAGDDEAQQRRRQLTDVLIEAARQRRAAQLAEAKRRAAAERGAGAFFVDVEAELSDEEEGIAALDDLEDEYDGEDLDEGMLASLLGTAREGVADEARRAELHAMWEEERDSAAVRELLEAVRRGFRRKRRNGLGGLDDDEDATDHDARRRRAQLFASTVGDDDDAPIKVARGHGLDLDLAREDEDDIEALPPPPESGSGTQDGGLNPGGAARGKAGGGASLPPPAARASARFPLGRGVGGPPGFGGISRILDPVEAKRQLRQQSQEVAVPAARWQDGSSAAAVGGSSPSDRLDPSPLRSGSGAAAAAAAARAGDDVVALLQRSASAALAGPVTAAAEPAAGAAPGGGAGHRFTLFGSDITNRTAAGSAAGQLGPGASTFVGRSAAPTSLRTTSNAAGGVNTRSFVFGGGDASNSGFPEKSKDAATAAAADGGGVADGGGAAGVSSFAALRSVIGQQTAKADGRRGGGGGGGLMGLLGLSGGGAAGGGGSGSDGRGGAGGPSSSSLDLKRKLVTGDMAANKRRV